MLNKLDIPQDIIDAALKVRRWAEANDLKGWSLCGIGPVGSAAQWRDVARRRGHLLDAMRMLMDAGIRDEKQRLDGLMTDQEAQKGTKRH